MNKHILLRILMHRLYSGFAMSPNNVLCRIPDFFDFDIFKVNRPAFYRRCLTLGFFGVSSLDSGLVSLMRTAQLQCCVSSCAGSPAAWSPFVYSLEVFILITGLKLCLPDFSTTEVLYFLL